MSLAHLPPELILTIAEHLDAGTLSRLSRTSRRHHHLLAAPLTHALAAHPPGDRRSPHHIRALPHFIRHPSHLPLLRALLAARPPTTPLPLYSPHPLHLAITSHNTPALRLLLPHLPCPYRSLLAAATTHANAPALSAICAHLATTLRTPPWPRWTGCETAVVHAAARSSRANRCLAVFLARGLDRLMWLRALRAAAEARNPRAVRELCTSGSAQEEEEDRGMHMPDVRWVGEAAEAGDWEMVRAMVGLRGEAADAGTGGLSLVEVCMQLRGEVAVWPGWWGRLRGEGGREEEGVEMRSAFEAMEEWGSLLWELVGEWREREGLPEVVVWRLACHWMDQAWFTAKWFVLSGAETDFWKTFERRDEEFYEELDEIRVEVMRAVEGMTLEQLMENECISLDEFVEREGITLKDPPYCENINRIHK